jgi:hypothetical protein
VPRDKPGPIKLTLSDDQLTQQLRQGVGSASPDAKVGCEPGLIVVTGTYHKGPLVVPMRVAIVPYIEHAALAVYIKQATIAGAPLPSEVSMQIATRIKRLLQKEQGKMKGLVLDTVEARSKEIEFTGHFAGGAKPG